MKSKLKKISPLLYQVRKYRNYMAKKQILKNPRVEANKTYKSVFGRDINWDNPTDLIEKTYWLQLNTDTTLWSSYADKYEVREFIKEQGFENMLNELYGVWDKPEDIDWDSLPTSFVIKSTNGCGQIIIVKDKNNHNKEKTVKDLKQWIKLGYGYQGAQLHYIKIKPRIIAEKLLTEQNNSSKSLIDYKIWCFNGKPESILVVTDRDATGKSLSFYDTEWNNISEQALNKERKAYSGKIIEKPKSLDKMLEAAKKLSQGFPQVRMDFYDIDGNAVFGEMTFTTGFGNYSDEYYRYLGSKIDLSKVEK